MARTSASRGIKGYKLKHGNTTTFKMMGSSPVREATEVITKGEEKLIGETTTETDSSTDVKSDYRRIDTGYTPSTRTAEGDAKYAALSQAEKNAQDAKYIKANTRRIVVDRSENKSTPKEKEQTPQEKMAKGMHHSKYYDPNTKEYRVKQYAYKQLPSGKYSSKGRGEETGDISLAEWKEQNPSLASEGTKGTKF